MKLLLDENLSRRLVPFLQKDFPGSTQVALLNNREAIHNALDDDKVACIELGPQGIE